MSSRLHNKYHRHNHHTTSTPDPRYPDSGHDPIASHDSPFMGPFVMYGTLSAIGATDTYLGTSLLSATPGGVFEGFPVAIKAVALSGTSVGTALQTEGNIETAGSISATGNVSAANVFFTNTVVAAYTTPVTSTGEFLTVNVNGTTRLIRLWNSL